MTRVSLALSLVILSCACVAAQSLTRPKSTELKPVGDRTSAAQAILALRKLDDDVIVYGSLGEFEANGKLARVSLPKFESDFELAVTQVEPLLARIQPGKLRSELTNTLASYRDGLFWWRQIDQPRVVHVSSLTASEGARANSDAAFLATVPYTVAIHWRQARKYLNQAEASRIQIASVPLP